MKNLARIVTSVIILAVIAGVGAGMFWWKQENVRLYFVPDNAQIAEFSPGDLIVTVDGSDQNNNKINGRAIADLPAGGYIFDFMRRPAAMIAIVYLPAMLIAASEIKKITRHRSYKPYKITQYL